LSASNESTSSYSEKDIRPLISPHLLSCSSHRANLAVSLLLRSHFRNEGFLNGSWIEAACQAQVVGSHGCFLPLLAALDPCVLRLLHIVRDHPHRADPHRARDPILMAQHLDAPVGNAPFLGNLCYR